MIKRIVEIGVAVTSIEETGGKLQHVLGARVGKVIRDDVHSMTAQMLRIGNVEFELMEPLRKGGIIAKFLQYRGEGLHHIAFQVDDIRRSIGWLKYNEIDLLNEEPVTAEGCKAVFLHPLAFEGVLIELIEGNPSWVDDSALPVELCKPMQAQCIGTEGILEIGILAKNLETASVIYSKILSTGHLKIAEASTSGAGMTICRAGNVNLRLIKITEAAGNLSIPIESNRPGMKYLSLKVGSIDQARNYLKETGVRFTEIVLTNLGKSKSLFIDPHELGGIPILLKE